MKHNTQPTTESEYKKTFHLSLVSIGYVYLKNSLSYANLNYEFHIYHRQVTSDRFFSVLHIAVP